jgi:hypothetical protein
MTLQVVAEVGGCHSALKTSAPIVLGTVPLISYQPAFASVQKDGGDTCGGIGWTVPSVAAELPPPYVQPDVPQQAEPHTVPSAPQLDMGECEEPSMPLHGLTAPLYPDIRMYTSLKIIFLILADNIVKITVYTYALAIVEDILQLCSL